MVTQSKGDGFALYGGVKLPNIESVWTDKSKYPYALLANNGEWLYLSPYKFSRYSNGAVGASVATTVVRYSCESGSWASLGELITGASGSSFYFKTPIWANEDIWDIVNNSTYLAASTPIPLDGMEVIEWDGDTTGLETMTAFYKVADNVLTAEQAVGAVIVGGSPVGVNVLTADFIMDVPEQGLFGFCNGEGTPMVASVYSNTIFPSTGILFADYGEGYRTTLFAYPASSSPTFDTTSFLSGLTMGLTGKGVPGFDATDTFEKGYLLGCELRSKRVVTPVASMYLYGTPSDSGNIGLRSGESVSYYNGAVLPDINCLLTAEQKAKYPFLWIDSPFNAGRSYRMYALPKVEVHYSSGVHWFGVWGDDVSYITAVYEDGQWGEAEEKTGGTNTFVGAGIWKNFDISYESEVLSSASPAPIPVSGVVAYSYNGTLVSSVYPDPYELPEYTMPEDAAREYPYKLYRVSWTASIPFGETYMFTAPVFVDGDNLVTKDGEYVEFLMYETMFPGYRNDWEFVRWEKRKDNLINISSGSVKWANFDVYNIDGSLYLEGTDAIPVYE